MRSRILPVLFIAWLCWISEGWSQVDLHTDSLKISIDGKGLLQNLFDKNSGTDYLAPDQPSALLSVGVGNDFYPPESAVIDEKTGDIVLRFKNGEFKATIRTRSHFSHITFELMTVDPEGPVDLVLWGPFATTINGVVGETVGVVRNGEYSIGIQALNLKTLGGYPATEDDVMPMYDIFAGSDYSDIEKEAGEKELFRGDTARPTSFGSVLQAYSRDRSKERVISNWGHDRYMVPPFDSKVIGSRIALFGCPEPKTLEIIGRIEEAEGLPHPQIDGEWGKVSPGATASYLIMGFGEADVDEAIQLTGGPG